jgi:hypothetical protein
MTNSGSNAAWSGIISPIVKTVSVTLLSFHFMRTIAYEVVAMSILETMIVTTVMIRLFKK